MAASLLAAALALATPQDGAADAGDLTLRVAAGATDVELGKPFALTVAREWRADFVPEPWSDAALAPLTVKLLGVEQSTRGERIAETRRYDAWAFTVGPVIVQAPWFRATPRDGGAAQIAFGDELRLTVRSSLPEPAGGIELPGPPLAAPRGRSAAVLAAALALALLALGWRARRARGRARPALPASAPARALAALAALRAAAPPKSATARRADAIAAARLLRAYLDERFALRAPHKTSDELLAAAPAIAGAHRELLTSALARLDLVKFARHAPSDAARDELLDDLERFVRETAGP